MTTLTRIPTAAPRAVAANLNTTIAGHTIHWTPTLLTLIVTIVITAALLRWTDLRFWHVFYCAVLVVAFAIFIPQFAPIITSTHNLPASAQQATGTGKPGK